MNNWQKEVDWKLFASRVIEKNGNPSLTDARASKIPDGIFSEMCMRNISKEKWIWWANEIERIVK